MDRTVVYSVGADAEPVAGMAQRLRDAGVEIVDLQAHMMLVTGEQGAIASALDAAVGWKAGSETSVPRPPTRPVVAKPPQ